MIKYSVRSLVAAGLSPASVLGEVNRMVAETGDASDIVTLWVGRYDPQTGELSWSSGGILPRRCCGRTARKSSGSQPTGPLLGRACRTWSTGRRRSRLSEDDTVLLYTDGVTEARNGNVFFGEERVKESVMAGGTPREQVRRLLTAVRRFARGDLRDDVALLAVTVRTVEREGTAREGRSDT